jgi:hypothetical protein
MAISRADKITELSKKQDFFSDFFTDFETHPITNNLARVTNDQSVKQSIRNLILTNRGERFFEPNIGSDILRAVFEPNDILTANDLQRYIEYTIKFCEPRAKLQQVSVTPSLDGNEFVVTILFSIINNPVPISLDVILKRVR